MCFPKKNKRFVTKNFTILKKRFLQNLNPTSYLKNTHRENTPSSKTKALTKSMNMRIWEIGTLNRLFTKGCYIEIKISKKLSISWQICVLCGRSILYSPFYFS